MTIRDSQPIDVDDIQVQEYYQSRQKWFYHTVKHNAIWMIGTWIFVSVLLVLYDSIYAHVSPEVLRSYAFTAYMVAFVIFISMIIVDITLALTWENRIMREALFEREEGLKEAFYDGMDKKFKQEVQNDHPRH